MAATHTDVAGQSTVESGTARGYDVERFVVVFGGSLLAWTVALAAAGMV